MGWIIIVIIAYLPIIYILNKRLSNLEERIKILEKS